MYLAVPGITCITPMAPTDERTCCCHPLSCHATAFTRAGSTPCEVAWCWSDAPMDDCDACGSPPPPPPWPRGTLSFWPILRKFGFERRLRRARFETEIPKRDAIPDSV